LVFSASTPSSYHNPKSCRIVQYFKWQSVFIGTIPFDTKPNLVFIHIEIERSNRLFADRDLRIIGLKEDNTTEMEKRTPL
jgi:hypothetical protein